MILREVTIGRSPNSDILCGPECVYVSNRHALIYTDGNQLMYRDISTNGTMINNLKVHRRAIPINVGDSILLAGKFPISWNQIGRFFPLHEFRSLSNRERFHTMTNNEKSYNNSIKAQEVYEASPTDNRTHKAISSWNWGAFFLYPFWGFANGAWWAFLVAIFFAWSFPIPNIVFGICGSKWAWENKMWRNTDHFISVQDSWKKWGIGIFVVNIGLMTLFSLWFLSFV